MMRAGYCLILGILVCSFSATAGTVVRLELQRGLSVSNIDIKLFDSVAPVSVNSFLGFVDAAPVANAPNTFTESYDNSIIHRNYFDLALEGGKFSYVPPGAFSCGTVDGCPDGDNEDFQDGLQRITEDPPSAYLSSEFSKLNRKGTIAMQQIEPNRFSTSQWFINLEDNPSFDINSGPFGIFSPYTVIGEIVNSTMVNVDSIVLDADIDDYDCTDIHFNFTAIPLFDYPSMDCSTPITDTNLVKINTASKLASIEYSYDGSRQADSDFGYVLINTQTDNLVTVTNLSAYEMSISGLASTDPLSLPFENVMVMDSCSGANLLPLEACTFTIRFMTSEVNSYSDTFEFEFELGDGAAPEKAPLSLSYSVSAEAVLTLEQDIALFLPEDVDRTAPVTGIDLGAIKIDTSRTKGIIVDNSGTANLDISAITLSGDNSDEFSVIDNCVVNSPIDAKSACALEISFNPVSKGDKVAELVITSDDPDEPVLRIPLSAYGDTDNDGIPASIEDQSPNGGDNNGDGIQDSLQDNVASLDTTSGDYVSILVREGMVVYNISEIVASELAEKPVDADFRYGAIVFDIAGIDPVASIIEVGLVYPAGAAAESVFFIAFDEDGNQIWLQYDAAGIVDNASLTMQDGTVIRRNFITIQVQDSGPGDTDALPNGVLTGTEMAVSFRPLPEGDSSGAVSLVLLAFIMLISSLGRFAGRKSQSDW